MLYLHREQLGLLNRVFHKSAILVRYVCYLKSMLTRFNIIAPHSLDDEIDENITCDILLPLFLYVHINYKGTRPTNPSDPENNSTF
jgi:hypothetical protein